MTEQPLFSVVIPVYNRAQAVVRAIASVCAQTLTDYELIVVDDGSTDDTVTLVRDSGVPLLLLCQENSGPAAARNLGIKSSTGIWVAFLDSDDLWLPEHLAELKRIVESYPEAGLIYCRYAVLLKPDEPAGCTDASGVLSQTNYTSKRGPALGTISTSACAIRRSLLFAAGGFPNFPCGEDTVLFFWLGTHYPIGRSSRVTSYYIRHGEGIMDTIRIVSAKDEVNAALYDIGRELENKEARRRALSFVDTRVLSKMKTAILQGQKEYVRHNLCYLSSRMKKASICILLAVPAFVWRLRSLALTLRRP